jgi:hypothetical protein
MHRRKLERDANEFQSRTGKPWVDSKWVNECAECGTRFSVLNRKHHCRKCGEVVCKNCSPDRMLIGNQRLRVCHSCYEDISLGGGGFSVSSNLSEANNSRCVICHRLSGLLAEKILKAQSEDGVSLYWHQSCLKCEYCQTLLGFESAYIHPPIGSILHTLENVKVRCFCRDHLDKFTGIDNTGSITHETNIESEVDGPESPIPVESERIEKRKSKHLSKPKRIQYGPSKNSQYMLLYIPQYQVSFNELGQDSVATIVPMVVIIHGGFWKEKFSIRNSGVFGLVSSFLDAGIAVCLLEYRRVGAMNEQDEGGWPETGYDLLAALTVLKTECDSPPTPTGDSSPTTSFPPLSRFSLSRSKSSGEEDLILWKDARIDLTRVVLLGHSAGGTLALWACCQPQVSKLPFPPLLCLAIAPVCDLIEADRRK